MKEKRMIRVRRSQDRGHANHGWLESYHTFSFATYQDPKHTRFRTLRVMNEDFIAPGQGFGTHPHENMEIVTYVLEGALEHKDSMGNGEVLRPGEFQRMSAGTGITHSEFNPSSTDPVHLYQIWLFPDRKGITPSYEQKRFPEAQRQNRWCLVASPDAEDEALKIHQDAKIYLANLDTGCKLTRPLNPDRYGWLQVLRGSIKLGDVNLTPGDGAAISDASELPLEAIESAELMLFDLP